MIKVQRLTIEDLITIGVMIMKSTQLKGYLTGLILGDGHIDKGKTKKSFSIKSINFDFIHKIEKDLEFTNFKIRVRTFPPSIINGVSRRSYKELTIRAHPYFVKMYPNFYNDTRGRVITEDYLDRLNEEGLANWYMSDGYIVHVGKTKGKIVDRRVELCLDRYTSEDVDKVIKYFTNTLGYRVHKVRRKIGVYRIRISLLDSQDFFIRILKHITPSMMYKLDLKYDYQPRWMCDEYFSLMNKIDKRVAPNFLTEEG